MTDLTVVISLVLAGDPHLDGPRRPSSWTRRRCVRTWTRSSPESA